jgi:hypothetical protein
LTAVPQRLFAPGGEALREPEPLAILSHGGGQGARLLRQSVVRWQGGGLPYHLSYG